MSEVSERPRPTGWRRLLPPPWRNPPPVVGVVRCQGVIAASTQFRTGVSMSTLAGPIQKAFGLGQLKAVALLINSPGGSPVQSTLILKRVRALAEEKKVPVFTFCEDVAASGGYILALAGDEIFADRSSIVGSIGVISAGFGFVDAIGKLGIERRVYTAGEKKMTLDPFQAEKPDDVTRLKAIQANIHETFKAIVRDRRGGALNGEESDMFTGEFWTGPRAQELGLVDGIGDVRSVMRERFGDNVKLQLVSAERSWPWRRATGFRLDGGARLTDGLAEDLIQALEARALWSRYGL